MAAVFLSFVGYNKFSLPLDTATFNPESMYRGTSDSSNIDPKDYYYKLHGLTMNNLEDESCRTAIKSSTNIVSLKDTGNYIPIEYTINEETGTDYQSIIGVAGEELFEDGVNIIMPVSTGRFKNSNMLNSSLEEATGNRKDIEVIVSDRILIVFEDVKTWWCHLHNTAEGIKHDKAVGNFSTSDIKEVRGGFIIGMAKEDTRIKVYHVSDSMFKNNITTADIEDIKSLEQIDAGRYLTSGEIQTVKK